MPQGYKNAPEIFQRGVNMILEGLVNEICPIYIDDLLGFVNNHHDQDKNPSQVKNRLDQYK